MPNHPSRMGRLERGELRESPATPQDVPMHPRAAAVWRQHGFLL